VRDSCEIFDSAIAATIEASKILVCLSNLKTEPKYTLRTRNGLEWIVLKVKWMMNITVKLVLMSQLCQTGSWGHRGGDRKVGRGCVGLRTPRLIPRA